MTIETILNSDMSVAYITDCATSPVSATSAFQKKDFWSLEEESVPVTAGVIFPGGPPQRQARG
jgi:hypothetical protein